MKNLKLVHIIVIALCLSLSTSCQLGRKSAARILLGINFSADWMSEAEITEQTKKYKIDSAYNLVLDTLSYFNGLHDIYSQLYKDWQASDGDSVAYFSLKEVSKDDTQPVQLRIFNQTGKEVFKIVNCYVDPPIPMNWNVEGCLDQFPPQTISASLAEHHFDLDFLLSHTQLMNGEKLQKKDLPQTDYYVVILWNDFMRKPSRNLIQTFREKQQGYPSSLTTIYINNHNAYIWAKNQALSKNESS